MNTYIIQQTKTGKVLFEGKYKSFNNHLEDAVENKVNLKGANLSRKNLATINIDNAQLSEADFSFSNLTMANLSEGEFSKANFLGANLIGACMAESDFSRANFLSASFGANILTQSNFDHCLFSTLSAFQLPFTDTASMQGCSFYFEDELLFSNSKPPVVVTGLTADPIIISENAIHLGHKSMTSDKIILRNIPCGEHQKLCE